MDPIEFRLKNYAEQDPEKKRPWSSKSLRECYRVGAERFGWSKRPHGAAFDARGNTLIGWGMATAVYPTRRSAATAVARLHKDGTVLVEAGTQDLGTGTYTVMTQIAADAIGVLVRTGDVPPGRHRLSGDPGFRRLADGGQHRVGGASRRRSAAREVDSDWRSAISGRRCGR